MRFAAPWQYWQLVDQYKQNEPDEYDFNIRARPKQRTGKTGRTKARTRTYESTIYEDAAIQAPDEPITGRAGIEILYLINSKNPPRHDMDNAIKSLKDALNRRAYEDDRQVDYLSALRVYGPDEPNRTIARVYEF